MVHTRELSGALRGLVDLVGDGAIALDDPTIDRYATDAWPVMRKLRALGLRDRRPRAVLLPSSTEEVAAMVRFAGGHGLTITPYGGGSNVVGATESDGGIILSTERLDRIVEFDEVAQLVHVEAGVRGDTLENELGRRGYTLGHYPQSLPLSTVGGWIATRASGTFSSYYGGIEGVIAGLTVVMATGDVLAIPPAPRHAAGPNPVQIFIGSEGTLGVVTSAWLQVCRCPEVELPQAYLVPGFETGLDVLRDLMQRGLMPALARLYNPAETASILDGCDGRAGRAEDDCLLLCAHIGVPSIARAQEVEVAHACTAAGARGIGADPVAVWMKKRYEATAFWEVTASPGRILDTIEVCAPWSRVAAVARNLDAALRAWSSRVLIHASHVYTTGASLYAIFIVEDRDDRVALERHARAWDAAIESVTSAGGLPAHHHGIGVARAQWFEGSDYGALYRRIKGALDPGYVLNPGKLDRRLSVPSIRDLDGV